MKRIYLLGGLVVFIVAIAAFLYTRISNQAVVPTQPLPITTITALSALPKKIPSAPGKVSFTYTGPAVSLPSQLPTYAVSYSSSYPAQTSALAKQWGFANPVKHPVPYVYDWVDDDKELSFNDQAKSISFSLFTKPTSSSTVSSLSPTDVFTILTNLGFFSGFFSFSETSRQTVSGSGEGDASVWGPVTVITYQSNPVNQSVPFFFTGVSRATGEIRMSSQGNIISFSFFVTPQVTKEQDRQVLNRTDLILQELNSQKGYLSGLSGATIAYPFEETANFTSVTISSISIGYLYIPEQTRFIPIAICEGIGNGPNTQNVRYYVRISS